MREIIMDNTASRTKQTSQQAKRFAIGMTLPTLAVLLVMTAYPLISTFLYSFTDYNYLKGADRAEFVLFKNYISLLENGYFRQAIWNTVRFTFLAVVLELGFGLVLAIFVNSLGRGKRSCGRCYCSRIFFPRSRWRSAGECFFPPTTAS